MKTKYITPTLKVHTPKIELMISKESNPNDDEILGKRRYDDVDDKKESDTWSDGLW